MPNWVANHITIRGENAVEVLHSLLTEREIENKPSYDFDFNKIIQMPESLQIESGSTTDSCVEMYLTSINPFVEYYGDNKVATKDYLKIYRAVQNAREYKHFDDRLPIEEIHKREKETCLWNGSNDICNLTKEEVLNYGKTAVNNVLTYGAMDWYVWSCKNWGTKWNACRTQIPDPEEAEVYFDTAWSPVTELIRKLSKQHPDYSFEYEYAEEQPGEFAGKFELKAGKIICGESYETNSKECYEMFFQLWGCEDDFKFNESIGTYEYIEDQEVM